ncbi:hypothetical protein [Pseudogemmobacter sonorensis]|uniref:hypothetical protein n=1 Tax=Pseudogemmobacter sonorensis TaxID=2989681 RepID=UPI003F663D77
MDPVQSELHELLDAVEKVWRAFGAPGDHGYGTREGDAVFALYSARSKLLIAIADQSKAEAV